MRSPTCVNEFKRFVAVATIALACVAVSVNAQMPDPGAAPYEQMPDPNALPPSQQSKKGKFKQLFAGTLSAVLQASGAGLAAGLTSAMTGAIQNWFSKPPETNPGMAGDAAAGLGGMTGQLTEQMPSDAMGMTTGIPSGTPDAIEGMPPTAMPPSLYAGLAYEVVATGSNGESMTVDPATHYFATGDRFVVMYRPSLPGQVAIYNVNPLGQEKQIDVVNVAAGELTRLGPYEFQANTGTELLRLILSPCRNDGLMAATRDIVKVDEMESPAAANPASGALALPDCATVAARSDRPQTRDIVKVGAEEGTMFALDPVSQQEIQDGNFTPRELTLTFNHR